MVQLHDQNVNSKTLNICHPAQLEVASLGRLQASVGQVRVHRICGNAQNFSSLLAQVIHHTVESHNFCWANKCEVKGVEEENHVPQMIDGCWARIRWCMMIDIDWFCMVLVELIRLLNVQDLAWDFLARQLLHVPGRAGIWPLLTPSDYEPRKKEANFLGI